MYSIELTTLSHLLTRRSSCNAIRLFKLSKLFTSKADYKERTTFVRARPSWIPLLPSPDVTSLMPSTMCVDGVGWTAERGEGSRLARPEGGLPLQHSLYPILGGGGSGEIQYITQPSPFFSTFYNIRIQGYAFEL